MIAKLSFVAWCRRDPLAVRKLALWLNLTALLMIAISVILQIQCLLKQQPQAFASKPAQNHEAERSVQP